MMATDETPMDEQERKVLHYNLTVIRDRRNWMRDISRRLSEWAYQSYEPVPDCLQGMTRQDMGDIRHLPQLIAWRDWVDSLMITRRQNEGNLQSLLLCVKICSEPDTTDTEEITARLDGLKDLFLDYLEQEWGIERRVARKLQYPHRYARHWAYSDLSTSVDSRWLQYDIFMLKGDR